MQVNEQPLTSVEENRIALRGQQEALFQKMIRLCFHGHPYYRRLFQEHGLTMSDFRGLADLTRLPLTHKADLMAQPEQFRLNLEEWPEVSLEERILRDVIYTSGSTGHPTPFYDTTHDHFSRINQMKRAGGIAGLVPDDVVINLFPLTSVPHQGFLSAFWGATAIGAKHVAALTGRPYPDFPIHNALDQAVGLIEEQRGTVLWGIASYVRRVVMRAHELERDFSAVRLVLAMGESCPAGMREDLRTRLGMLGARNATILNGYGFTEMQGPTMECVEMGGYHLPTPSQYYFEILDPVTHQPLPEGQPGLVVVSHLNRRGTVLLRYVAGDICAFSSETCPACGRTEPRFTSSPYRVNGLIKVKGTLMNPAAIHEELSHLQTKGLVEYQIAVVKIDPDDVYSADTILIRMACSPEQRDWLATEVRERVIRASEVSPRIEVLPPDAFNEQVQAYKFKRFVDERGLPSR